MPMAGPATPSWHAVGIVPCGNACEAALALRGRRFLPANIKRLPLAECTRQDQCSCKFHHYSDRRGAPRRAQGAGSSGSAKPPATERRRPGERRERRK